MHVFWSICFEREVMSSCMLNPCCIALLHKYWRYHYRSPTVNSISNCVMVSDLHPNSCSESCSESSCQWQFKLKLWMLLLAKLVQWKFVFWKLHGAIQAGDLKACVRLSKSCSSEAQWSKVDVLKTKYSELSTFWKMEFWSYGVRTMQYMWYQ